MRECERPNRATAVLKELYLADSSSSFTPRHELYHTCIVLVREGLRPLVHSSQIIDTQRTCVRQPSLPGIELSLPIHFVESWLSKSSSVATVNNNKMQ